MANIRTFRQLDMSMVSEVGGKNASLGEMLQNLEAKGIRVPDGFATTADAYWKFVKENQLRERMVTILEKLDVQDFTNLNEIGIQIRSLILESQIPDEVQQDILLAYKHLQDQYDVPIQVAVRSSATAEDLPTASFAGQLETYLNINGDQQLLRAVLKCYASLFTDRAIKYRHDQGFDHMQVALSVGVQRMVRSDKACSGVAFTLDPDSGFENAVLITGAWGLGENVVQGTVNLDEFLVFKPTLRSEKQAIISKILGEKEQTMIYAEGSDEDGDTTVVNLDTSPEKRKQYILRDDEINKLALWMLRIEEHYDRHMDVEWAKDGLSEELFIVQARPETVHSGIKDRHVVHSYKLKEQAEPILLGISVGNKIAAGKARILHSPDESHKLQKGEILVTGVTNPDWDPILKKAGGIVTNRGGRTSHAAIVARELGTTAVVGTGNATEEIQDGQEITINCTEGSVGKIYEGILEWEEEDIHLNEINRPSKVDPMLILGDPDKAFTNSFLPHKGIGLMRLEFVINNAIGIHPMALIRFDQLEDQHAIEKIQERTFGYDKKEDFFIDKLAQGVGTIAAAFYPEDVIVRMSDFKTNEYANLIGGKAFEPHEENPMIGFRGASRYYSDLYREGFGLECKAMKKVREEMGLNNVKLMIPFCRTVAEGKKVIDIMASHGLVQGENELEVYVMVELPSNVMMAKEFAEVFDGFSIGSNDLTQLTMGLDRDSDLISDLFNEQDEAVKRMIKHAIQVARETGTKIGLCGQAPSDFPEFAQFLVQEGINSISFQADALLQGIQNINKAESSLLTTSS